MSKIMALCSLIALIQMSASASIKQASTATSSSGLFAADIIAQLAATKGTENVVFSPISIQSALAMTYLGAAGETAQELKNSLHLPSDDKDQVGEYFAEVLNKKSAETGLNIANKMFVSSDYSLKEDFNEKAQKYFNSEAEALDFITQPSEAVNTINTWVEKETNNKITNLLEQGSINSDTIALLVNAIYFKGEWKYPFSLGRTSKTPFYSTYNESVDVDSMFGEGRMVNYGEFPELNATAIEMPYSDSDLSMIFILPAEKDGLVELENKLASITIQELSSKMTSQKVDLTIPKFQIEFSTGLSKVLKSMGLQSIFGKADLSGIFQSNPNVKLSDVHHKAFIDVNEAGSEAAAASFGEITLYSLDLDFQTFKADHPFFFAIKDSNAVYFAGHVVKP